MTKQFLPYDFADRHARLCEIGPCRTLVLPPALFCTGHWSMVSEDMQSAIGRAVLACDRAGVLALARKVSIRIERVEARRKRRRRK